MDIELSPGGYVLAVSGGVDSVVLLHVLSSLPDVKLTVAHFDHGIRPDSDQDLRHVRALARQYGWPFVYHRAHLGQGTSEAVARQARYRFLHQVRTAAKADAIITAHHLDDVLETAILNIIRGTGRRGLTSLKSTDIVKRPLLHIPKSDIHRYARDNQLVWREDGTNTDLAYTRNRIRHEVLPHFNQSNRQHMHNVISRTHCTNSELDSLLQTMLTEHQRRGKLMRQWFIMLPHTIAREIMATWLRQHSIQDIDRAMIERLVHAAKTFAPGYRAVVNQDISLFVSRADLALAQ